MTICGRHYHRNYTFISFDLGESNPRLPLIGRIPTSADVAGRLQPL